MAEFQFTAFIANLVHGEIHNPAELIALLVHVSRHSRAKGLNQHACGFGGTFTGRNHNQRIRLQVQHLFQLCPHAVDKLGNAASQFALFVHLEPVCLAAGLHLAIGKQLFHLLAGQRAIRNIHHLHSLALQRLKLAVFKQSRDIFACQVNAQVRLVRAVNLQRCVVGDAPEGGRGGHIVGAELGKDRRQNILQNGKHILLGGKGHFHIQLIELAGAAVAAGVLIPEAGRDLEIPVKAGGHQQLLELLGCLRQCVELAGMLPGGYQVIPGALGGGGRQNGGGDLQKAMLGHGGAQGGHHLAAQDDVVFHSRIPQVQIPVFQPLGFVSLPAAVDFKGQAVVAAAAKYFDFVGHHLNVTGGLLGIFACPLPDNALHADGGFLVQIPDDGHHLFGFNHHLSGSVKVPQHYKGKIAADFPDIFHPAHNLYRLPGVAKAQLAAGMGAHLHHKNHSCFDSILYN